MSTHHSSLSSSLQPLLPLREMLAPYWENLAAGVAAAPDPALAATNLSRLVEHGLGSGAVLGDARQCANLLFILGASQHLTSVLVRQADHWETAFLADCTGQERTGRSVAEHLSVLRSQLPLRLSEEKFLRGLRAYREREYLRIGSRDLLALATVEDTTLDLSCLAEAAVQIAYEYTRAQLREAYGEAVRTAPAGETEPAEQALGFVVFGMGKLGGQDLNFSSDIDLIYLYEGDTGRTTGGSKGTIEPRVFFTHLAQKLTRALSEQIAGGRVFRVDLRLRPDGLNGPVVNSLPNMLVYYESWGQTWERAALLKARPIAGDIALGERFLRGIEPFVFRRYLDFTTVEDLKDMKARIERELHKSERGRRNVKLSRGGIREVEFVTQVLQLIHAGKDPHVRELKTLQALDRLVEGHYLSAADRDTLHAAYRFLRHVEHKIQVFQDRQTHTIPTDEAEVRVLARRLRLAEREEVRAQNLQHEQDTVTTDGPISVGANQPPTPSPQSPPDEVTLFWELLEGHREAVNQIFRSLFYAPEEQQADPQAEEIRAFLEELDHEEQALLRLQQLGFQDLQRSYQYAQLLHNGPSHAPATPKRRKILYALAPMLFQEVTRTADPDRALAAMADLVASIGARSSFLSLLRENPGVLRTLVSLFGTSTYLSQIFLRHPELLDSLVRADLVQVHKDLVAMQAELSARLYEVEDLEDRLDILRRYRTEEFLRIGINDSNKLLDCMETSSQLADLAEACLGGAYEIARTALLEQLKLGALPGRFVILGMGKLGAQELNYNSDLDIIFLYQADDPETSHTGETGLGPHEVFTKLAQRVISTLQVQTREGYVYKIDTRLRPSGRSGSLVSSIAAFERYHRNSSQLWERQALIKARVVAGDRSLTSLIDECIARIVYRTSINRDDIAEIDRLRGRMENELAREASDRFNIKTGRGGIVDIEFLVQMLQLRYGQHLPALRQRATLPALEALQVCEVLDATDVQALVQGYRFLRTLENRLRIDCDQPVEALESEGSQLPLVARRMGYSGEDAATELLKEYQAEREAIRACYTRLFEYEKGR